MLDLFTALVTLKLETNSVPFVYLTLKLLSFFELHSYRHWFRENEEISLIFDQGECTELDWTCTRLVWTALDWTGNQEFMNVILAKLWGNGRIPSRERSNASASVRSCQVYTFGWYFEEVSVVPPRSICIDANTKQTAVESKNKYSTQSINLNYELGFAPRTYVFVNYIVLRKLENCL